MTSPRPAPQWECRHLRPVIAFRRSQTGGAANSAFCDDGLVKVSGRTAVSVLAIVGASLLLGGLTSWAQGVLPDALASVANSPSGWTLLTALLVAAARPTLPWGAALGGASFVSLVLGYTIASDLRGLFYSPLLWCVVGVLAGPFVGGAAAAVVRSHNLQAALGAGALAGVFFADGIYGRTVIGSSTNSIYWNFCLVAGAALTVVTALRLRTAHAALVVIASTAASTGVLTLGYALLNST